MQQQDTRFYSKRILLTRFAQCLFTIGFVFYAQGKEYQIYGWLFPFLMIIALFGMKFAASRIPFIQLTIAVGTVSGVSTVTNILCNQVSFLFYFLGDFLIPIICVHGFGRYWVSKGYLPARNNFW
ncbi:hypothetical protein [Desulfobacula phenolica]|uniref:hypothetical protein n=1 Tax=Desulfobacula phenolica TaxID=90732 RepID=UPI000B87FB56|nr:hypothetical protein [Desulfobacula phenolica]